MTNKEKFKEVFGLEMDDTSDCGFFDCSDRQCKDCPVKDTKHWWNAEYKEPTTKNNLGVDCIDRAELLKAMDTWDKFGNDPNEGLIPLNTPALQDRYIPYVKYDDMVKCAKDMPSVTPIRPKGHWYIWKDEYDDIVDAICSNCEHHGHHKWSYCPNCGADMREVEE